MNKFLETIHDMIEIITGKRPETPKPKRARGKKGKFKADDISTKDFNEAWVGGKAPKKKTKRKTRKK